LFLKYIDSTVPLDLVYRYSGFIAQGQLLSEHLNATVVHRYSAVSCQIKSRKKVQNVSKG